MEHTILNHYHKINNTAKELGRQYSCAATSVLLYLLHPGFGVLSPAAVRKCSSEACQLCCSIPVCRRSLWLSSFLVCNWKYCFCVQDCVSMSSHWNLVPNASAGSRWITHYVLECPANATLGYVLTMSHEWLSCIEMETTRKMWWYVLILVKCIGKGGYKLVVEFNPKICHSVYLKYRHQSR